MNKEVFGYVSGYYYTAVQYVLGKYPNIPVGNISIDTFFDNWSINVTDGNSDKIYLSPNVTLSPSKFKELVEEAHKEGYFTKKTSSNSVRYFFSELGKEYIKFKVDL